MDDTLSFEERRALELMQKENFRGVSKENVMQLISVLDKVNPQVAMSLIAQMPEAIRGIAENEKTFSGILQSGIESCDSTTESCFQTEDSIVESLKKEIEKEDGKRPISGRIA